MIAGHTQTERMINGLLLSIISADWGVEIAWHPVGQPSAIGTAIDGQPTTFTATLTGLPPAGYVQYLWKFRGCSFGVGGTCPHGGGAQSVDYTLPAVTTNTSVLVEVRITPTGAQAYDMRNRTRPLTVTAAPSQYVITVLPSQGGTVVGADGGVDAVETPNGIACSGAMPAADALCLEAYALTSDIALKAVPDNGSAFLGWELDGQPVAVSDNLRLDGAAHANHTIKAIFLTLDLDAFWPGTMAAPGAEVSDADENDAGKLLLPVNNDDDNGDGVIDGRGLTLSAEDDEVMTLRLRQLTTIPRTGRLILLGGASLRLFTADGAQELSLPLSLDFGAPAGPLAAIMQEDVLFRIDTMGTANYALFQLAYHQDGIEQLRDDVAFTLIEPTVQGGFTRGSVKYVQALRFGGQWVVAHEFHADRPLSVLVPDARHLYTAMRYKRNTDAEYTDGVRVDVNGPIVALTTAWNAILERLGLSFLAYTPDQVLQWLSAASSIPTEQLETQYFMTDPSKPISEPGMFTVQLTPSAPNASKAELPVLVTKVGTLDALFRVIGETPACPWEDSARCQGYTPPDQYSRETTMTVKTDQQGRDALFTLGGMRLRVVPSVAAALQPAVRSYAMGAIPNDDSATYMFSSEILDALQVELTRRSVPNIVQTEVRTRLEGRQFASYAAVTEALSPIFAGFALTPEAINQLKTAVFKPAKFPEYYWGTNNQKCEKEPDGLCVFRNQFYANISAFQQALRTEKRPQDDGYATGGIRLTQSVLGRLDLAFTKFNEFPFEASVISAIMSRLKQTGSPVVCNDPDCLRGREGEGYSYRKIQGGTLKDFDAALHRALQAPRCTQNTSEPCCSSANNCQTWVGCGDDAACKTGVREVIQEEADIITQCGEEIRQRAALRSYQDIVTFFAGQYGHATGAFFPSYDTTRVDATRPDMRYPIPPLTSGELSGEIAPGQAAAIPDAYWESEPRSDVDAILELVLTLQDDDGIQQSVAVKRVVVSRELRQREPSNPPTTWDDVTMLQMVLRSLGMSQTEKPGYLGDVVLTGKFEASGTTSCTNLALGRFEYVDELIGIKPTSASAQQWCSGDGSPVLPATTTVLQKLFAHWHDYLAALEAYPQFRIIKAEIDQLQTVYSPDTLQAYQTAYQQWLLAGAGELSATYSDEQVRLVEGLTTLTHAQANESRARLLDCLDQEGNQRSRTLGRSDALPNHCRRT